MNEPHQDSCIGCLIRLLIFLLTTLALLLVLSVIGPVLVPLFVTLGLLYLVWLVSEGYQRR